MEKNTQLISAIKKLPPKPGVYLFKDDQGEVVYVGKAKHLKRRLSQYIQRQGIDIKVDAIFQESVDLDHIITDSELEAMLLEAKLIKSYQPRFNVLLKSGQPFLYLFIPIRTKLPELMLVRNKKRKGTYFGPFLDKASARKVYDFLIKTFQLRLCKIKIPNGCLYYHMGLCAGICKDDFNEQGYLERLELAKLSLQKGHTAFLKHLEKEIEQNNKQLNFERSKELTSYYQAFEQVFHALQAKNSLIEGRARKDIWVFLEEFNVLFVLGERETALTQKRVFYFPFRDLQEATEQCHEYFMSYYRTFSPPSIILVDFDITDEQKIVYEQFLQMYHRLGHSVEINKPSQGHFAALLRLARIHAEQKMKRQASVGRALKQLLMLDFEPKTIDCFDISHKQGNFMVGSCVRFTNGQPDKPLFRHFHIKTVEGQDDYASLREIVQRRYKAGKDLPDLVLIDGGKGQLNAVKDLFPDLTFVSLAKAEETVFSQNLPRGKKLDQKSIAGQLLISLRDYAHHFAISFHRSTELKKIIT
ncbi:MAG: excinuclease ABC subunit C [Epsilonproteobacteria bacterium]|nr:excinuclease ABC subunit C [Campylobacterota bacterium]